MTAETQELIYTPFSTHSYRMRRGHTRQLPYFHFLGETIKIQKDSVAIPVLLDHHSSITAVLSLNLNPVFIICDFMSASPPTKMSVGMRVVAFLFSTVAPEHEKAPSTQTLVVKHLLNT